MKKENRIKKNEEFKEIIAKKNYITNSSFIIYFNPKAQDKCRVGISVSKKNGNAVVRNKIKRQVREMVHSNIDFDTCPYDYVIIIRKDYLNNNYINNNTLMEMAIKKSYNKRVRS